MATETDVTAGEFPTRPETAAVPSRLTTLFGIHGVAQLGFALALVVAPELLAASIGWGRPFDPVMSRLAGAFLVGLGLGQVVAYRARTWDQVRLLYIVVVSESIVGLGVVLYSTITGTLGAAWLLVPLFVVFAPSFAYFLRYPQATRG